ncbi:hypothetical protein Tco_0452039 [Tanacetum coccineum]
MPWINFVVAKIDRKWCLCSIFITAVCCETAAHRSSLLKLVVCQSNIIAVCPNHFAAVCPNHFVAVWSDLLHSGLPKTLHGGLVNGFAAAHLPIGKSNLLMDLQKKQKNPIILISVDILQNTNFFRAFTASDEALGITPKDFAHPFVPPPAGDLAIKNFFSHMANLKVPTKKTKPPVIPYCRFTKMIIYYLGSRHNIHRRPQSPVHIMTDDYPLSNLKFVIKGGVDEVFGMPIPKDLLTDAFQNSKYYKKYLEMAARKPCQPTTKTGEEVKKKKNAMKADKFTPPALAKQLKPVKKKTSKPTPSKKIHKGKRSNHLVDEADEEPQPASELQVEDVEYNLKRGIQMSLESLQASIGGVVIRKFNSGFIQKLPEVEGKGKGIVSDEQAAQSLLDLHKPKKQNSTTDADTVANMGQSNIKNDTEILNVEEECGEEVSNMVALEERTVELGEGQAGSDPGKTPESRPPPSVNIWKKTRLDQTLDKLTTKEQVHIENPPSSSGTLSSMKNLEDYFTFGDQFINDKSTEEEPGKANVETEVESMVTVPIHQASSSVPPLSTPIINLSPPKPVILDPNLATRISTLEKISADYEQKNKLQDKITQAFASRVYKLEHHDLYFKINKQVNEVVKEAVHNALQAPLRERFKDLSKFQMKEILHDRMFKSNFYRSHPDHIALYDALEVSMQRENNDELHAALTKSCKRRRDDQDPLPPPPKDSDRSKKKKHDYDVSASKQPPVQKSLAWKTSDSKEAPSKEGMLFRSHIKILSVVSLKTFSRYGYTFLKEIVLRRADYKEYMISESDFKNLHPNDFEDLYLLNLQGKLNHLSGSDKVHLSTAVNLWTRNIVIRQRVEDLQLEDYTIFHKPRAVIYRDRNDQKKMMRETDVHKFSDGTLMRHGQRLRAIQVQSWHGE